MEKCPVCGEEVHSSDKRCKKCGTPLNNKKLNFSSSKLILGIVIVVLIMALVGAFVSGIFTGNDTNTQTTDDSSVVEPISEDSDKSTATEYWASAKTEKFHLPTCEWAEKISDDNKIVYHSRDEAISDGKVPCGVCNP